MAYQIIWSPEAVEDVDAIADYIHRDSPLYAQSVVERLITQSRTLNTLPLRARQVADRKDPSYRELFAYHYRLIYHIDEAQHRVCIAAIIHGARQLPGERFDDAE
jgi:addiction module RelE/StbE family toxin